MERRGRWHLVVTVSGMSESVATEWLDLLGEWAFRLEGYGPVVALEWADDQEDAS